MTTHVVCNVIFEIPACQLNVFTLLKFGTSRTRRAANKVRVRLALVSYLIATWTATKPSEADKRCHSHCVDRPTAVCCFKNWLFFTGL